jgi:hypothetical protein
MPISFVVRFPKLMIWPHTLGAGRVPQGLLKELCFPCIFGMPKNDVGFKKALCTFLRFMMDAGRTRGKSNNAARTKRPCWLLLFPLMRLVPVRLPSTRKGGIGHEHNILL